MAAIWARSLTGVSYHSSPPMLVGHGKVRDFYLSVSVAAIYFCIVAQKLAFTLNRD